MPFTATDMLAIGQIIWIDLLLSGDNAVVIAMACRGLPEKQRKLGIFLGAGAAVGLRIVFAYIISQLLGVPFLKIGGGLLLFWIAIKLVVDDHGHEEKDIAAKDKILPAVITIAMADAVMSLDNVVAIAAIAKENAALFIFGLALSIPLIVVGASVITNLIARFPILIWAGAAILGWVAGDILTTDHAAMTMLGINPSPNWHHYGAMAGAVIVLIVGFLLQRLKQPKTKS